MSDKTIRLTVDLTYNPDTMHGDDEDSIEWFNSMLFGNDLQLVGFGDLGALIGSVKVVSQDADRIEELTEQLGAAQDDAKEAEAYAEEVEADRKKTYEALLKMSRIHGEVEAKLAKAVEALEAFKEFDDLPTQVKRPDLFKIKVRKPILRTLAEIKGESHE